jgi:hypothetical protein
MEVCCVPQPTAAAMQDCWQSSPLAIAEHQKLCGLEMDWALSNLEGFVQRRRLLS